MNLRHWIINKLLHEDEYISKKTPAITELETSDKPEHKPPKPKKTHTKKSTSAPIVYGTDVNKGVIKQRHDKYCAYCYQDGQIYQKKGELKYLKQKLDKFHKMNKPAKLVWNDIFEIKPKKTSNHIYKNMGKYTITKEVNSTKYTFGRYTSYEKAEIIRNYLEFKKWDLTYLPKNITGHTRLKPDEYYLNMLPFIAGDAEYEMYLKK